MASGNVLTRLCAVALLGMVPLTLAPGIEDVFFSAWRAGQAIFLAPVLLLAGWRLASGRLDPKLTWATLPWALFGAWALAGVTWSVNPWDSLRRGFELTGAVTALWLGIACARHWPRLRGAAVWAAGLCTVYGLAQVAGWDPMPWSVKFGRAFGTLGNPDYYAGHLLLVIPLLASALWTGGRPGLAEVALVPLLVAGFLLSHVRGAWLAAMASAGWGAFWIWRAGGLGEAERRWLSRAGAMAAGLVIVLAAASPQFRGRISSIVSVGGYDATGRRFLWAVALKVAGERSFTGWGTGAFKFQFPRHQQEGAKFHLPQFLPYAYSEHAHSELLQFAAELGGIGVALFLWGLVAWFVPWMRELARLHAGGLRRDWWTQWAIGTSIAGAFIYGWVNFPFQIVPTALLFWILMGVSLGRMGGGPVILVPRGAAVAAGITTALFGAAGAWVAGSDLVGNGYLRHLRGQLESGNSKAAYAVALRAERMLPHDYRVYRSLARIAIKGDDGKLADYALAKRLALHPYLVDALADRADFDRENGRPDLALARYEEVLRQAPNFITAWVAIAGIRQDRGEWRAAAEAYARAEALQPGNSAWPHREALLYVLAGRFPEAAQAGARVEALEASPPGLLKEFAVDRGLLVRRMAEATRREPGFATGWVVLGQAAFEREAYSEAERAFAEAARLRPSAAEVRHNLAAALGMRKRYAEALAQDREAVRLNPGFTEAWIGVALSAWVLGDTDAARQAVGEALRIDPRSARALEIQRRLPGVTSLPR